VQRIAFSQRMPFHSRENTATGKREENVMTGNEKNVSLPTTTNIKLRQNVTRVCGIEPIACETIVNSRMIMILPRREAHHPRHVHET
jgi:hypothetical protein